MLDKDKSGSVSATDSPLPLTSENSNTQPSEPIGCPKAPVLVKYSSCTKNVEGTDCSSPSENTVEELGMLGYSRDVKNQVMT
uniref:Uncharacterized protein n=1 Tax=Fagus sylvatica TaxID=28930 RepID=A0A2N9J658_FAGSY